MSVRTILRLLLLFKTVVATPGVALFGKAFGRDNKVDNAIENQKSRHSILWKVTLSESIDIKTAKE